VHLVNEAAELKAAAALLHQVGHATEAELAPVAAPHPHHHGHHHRRHPVAVVAAEAVAEPVKVHHHGRKFLALLLLAGGAAGYHYWRKAQPQHDPWAEPFDEEAQPDYYRVAGDTAEKIGAAVGTTVAYGREAGEKIGEWTREGVSRVKARHAKADDDDLDSVRDTFLDGTVGEEIIVEERSPSRVAHIVEEAKTKVGPETHKLLDEALAGAEREAKKVAEAAKVKAEAAAHKLAEEAKALSGEAKVKAEAEAKKLLDEAKVKGEAEGRKLVAEVTTKAEAEVKKLVADGKAAHARHKAEKADVTEVEVVAVEPVLVEPVVVTETVAEPVVKVREI